jgi:hypothetical protein
MGKLLLNFYLRYLYFHNQFKFIILYTTRHSAINKRIHIVVAEVVINMYHQS